MIELKNVIYRKRVFEADRSALDAAGFIMVTEEVNCHMVWLVGGHGPRAQAYFTGEGHREAALESAIWQMSGYEDDLAAAIKDIEGPLEEDDS